MSTRGDWGGRLHVFSFVPSRGIEPRGRGGDPILWGSLRPLKLRALGEGRTKSQEDPLVTEVVVSASDDVYVERNRTDRDGVRPAQTGGTIARDDASYRHAVEFPTSRSVVAVMAAACAADRPGSPPGIFFPTVPIGDAYPSALMEGVLEVRSGCVFVAAHEDRWLLLWPEGFTTRYTDGELEVLDENGEVVGREGERLRVGGGETNPIEVGGSGAAERWATDLTGVEIPERCGDLYWIVSPF
jgi:hypothetical protein